MNHYVFRNSFHFDIKGVLLLQKNSGGSYLHYLGPLFHTNIKLHLYLHHFLSFLASVSPSDLSSAEQSEHGFQSHKMLAALLIQPLTLGPGLMLTSHVENSRAHTEITHGKYWGAAGRHGMENDKTGCPSSFSLNAGLSQFYSQRETFSSPSFE